MTGRSAVLLLTASSAWGCSFSTHARRPHPLFEAPVNASRAVCVSRQVAGAALMESRRLRVQQAGAGWSGTEYIFPLLTSAWYPSPYRHDTYYLRFLSLAAYSRPQALGAGGWREPRLATSLAPGADDTPFFLASEVAERARQAADAAQRVALDERDADDLTQMAAAYAQVFAVPSRAHPTRIQAEAEVERASRRLPRLEALFEQAFQDLYDDPRICR